MQLSGVKLNDQLVAAAARQQLPSVKKLFQFEAAPKKSAKSANTSVSKLYQAVVLSDNVSTEWLLGECMCHMQPVVRLTTAHCCCTADASSLTRSGHNPK